MDTKVIRIFCIVILSFTLKLANAQNQAIDSNAYKQWPSVREPILSNDGKYLFYVLRNVPIGSHTLVLQSTDGKWKTEYPHGLNNPYFSNDNKALLFYKTDDTLGSISLGIGAMSFKYYNKTYFKKEVRKRWIISSQESDPRTLLISDLKTKKIVYYHNVISKQVSQNGEIVVLKQSTGSDESLSWIDIINGGSYKLWTGRKVDNIILDEAHRQLVFKTQDEVWLFNTETIVPICILNKASSQIGKNLELSDLTRFSKDGKRLFVTLRKVIHDTPTPSIVDVWSYRDSKLRPEVQKEKINNFYLSVLDLTSFRITRMQDDNTLELFFPTNPDASDTLVLAVEGENSYELWKEGVRPKWSFISAVDGKRIKLNFLDNIESVSWSFAGKYLFYYDGKKSNYFSYEIATGNINNLTAELNTTWNNIDRDDFNTTFQGARGPVNKVWLKNDEGVLVYDRYDIWKLDPSNRKTPINLTNYYGLKNHTVFSILEENNRNGIDEKGQLYLVAFNKENKNNGFFRKEIGGEGDPTLLTMGPYIFDTRTIYTPDDSNFQTVKAKNAEMYIVRRMSAGEAPNFFSTRDFRDFKRLTQLHPEKKYNWYTTELHSWNSLEQRRLQGILYKPKNFDPNKKYPIIFNYYERRSDGLNAYIKPAPLCNNCEIDISTYVSRGYLVFVPDIYYKIGDPMQGTYDAVVSAAAYVSNLPFVDSRKMGLQGCSWGGFQTNYLITHTSLFSAACAASAASDIVSKYGAGSFGSGGSYYETGQGRMGGTLWENTKAYIKNSPVFRLNYVQTPLLIMHTKDDSGVQFSQAVELFTGLRRLGKKAWMLVYSHGNHGIDGDEAKDFNARMLQFFDHYLKDTPAPLWMTREFAAGTVTDNSLGLDYDIRTPGKGLLTSHEQNKIDTLMLKSQ